MLLPRAPKLLDSETRLPLIAYPGCLIKALSQESPHSKRQPGTGRTQNRQDSEDLSWSEDALWSEEDAFMAPKFFWPSMHSTKKPRH